MGAAALLMTVPVAGQAAAKSPAGSAATAVKASAIPRTPDGHPDLSGVYTIATDVPALAVLVSRPTASQTTNATASASVSRTVRVV